MITLNIQTINSNLQIDYEPSKIEIENKSPGIIIEKNDAKLDVYVKSAKLEIDSYPAFKQLNYRNLGDFTDYYGSISRQNATEAIAEYASDGDAMMKIENKQDTIVAIAERKGIRFNGDTVNIQYFPEEPVDIKVIEGGVDGDFTPGFIEVKSNAKLEINGEKGKVIYNIDRYPKVNIEPVGSIFDFKV